MNKKLVKEIVINYVAWLAALTLVMSAVVWVEWEMDARLEGENVQIQRSINYAAFLFVSFVIAASTVIHYYVLYTRFFHKGLYGRYIAGVFILLVGTVLFDNTIATLAFRGITDYKNEFIKMLVPSIMRNAFLYTPAALFYTMIKANVALRKRRRQLEQQQLESSITALKNQLDPHFLFNTLNTVYATAMQEQAVKTASSIEELSELFRYAIQEAGQLTVPVEKELAFIDKYLQLQRLRLPGNDNIHVTTNIHWDKRPAFIAPMILLPFIENAFKYGISYKQRSTVDVTIAINNNELKMEVVNTDFSSAANTVSTGIGLANAVKRLELQYPGRFILTNKAENGLYSVSLNVSL